MSFILNIETSTTLCSVSISKNNELLALKQIDNGYSHAENLHIFINELLIQTNLKPTQLSAVAVSKGPGSYTGLRIGVSAAKGLCYALNIPLISINTLQIMANSIVNKMQTNFYCPMLDARRMEVYTAIYDCNLNTIHPTQALIVDELSIESYKKYTAICFFGNGMPKCKNILNTLPNASFIEDIKPSAQNMVNLSYHKYKMNTFENIAYFEPFYLKDFLITTK